MGLRKTTLCHRPRYFAEFTSHAPRHVIFPISRIDQVEHLLWGYHSERWTAKWKWPPIVKGVDHVVFFLKFDRPQLASLINLIKTFVELWKRLFRISLLPQPSNLGKDFTAPVQPSSKWPPPTISRNLATLQPVLSLWRCRTIKKFQQNAIQRGIAGCLRFNSCNEGGNGNGRLWRP